MKKLMLMLCLSITLFTGCGFMPKEEEAAVVEETFPETIDESVISMEAGVEMSVCKGDMISADFTEMQAVVYCDSNYEDYYTVNVMLTNDVNMLDVYENISGTEAREYNGWKFLTYEDQTIAGKKVNDNQYCVIQTYMPQEVLELHLPEVV